MISFDRRIDLLVELGGYMRSDDTSWQEAKQAAFLKNGWFDIDNINIAAENIAENYLQRDLLTNWAKQYSKPTARAKVGIVAAGNIPMVGFHDMLCSFVSGHITYIKLSSKDEVLMKHMVKKLTEWEPGVASEIIISENLKGCDAYIATGSNNTSRYFEYYFGKYPNIIRKNRTSVAVLKGIETKEQLGELGKDIFTYYGLGCRNVTKLYVPEGYNFEDLMAGMEQYSYVINQHKYRNNYDYNLAIYLLNKVSYLSNDFLLLVENAIPFSPVSVLHYEYYTNEASLSESLHKDDNIQDIVDNFNITYGKAQKPRLDNYADNVDTMAFLAQLGHDN